MRLHSQRLFSSRSTTWMEMGNLVVEENMKFRYLSPMCCSRANVLIAAGVIVISRQSLCLAAAS